MIREVLTLDRLRSMRPDEAASTLLVRQTDGQAALDDDALEAWLSLDKANARAWARAQSVWGAFDDIGEDDTLERLRAEARRARKAPPFRWHVPAAAAAVCALVLSGVWLAFLRSEQPVPRAPVQAASAEPLRYATEKGEREVATLPDGSRITLDTETVVEVAYSAGARGVVLRAGRAHFEVAPQPGRPFSVTAAGREVVAVATRFDVRLDPGQLRVLLLEGRVTVGEVGSTAAPAVLQAGEQFVHRDGAPPEISRIVPRRARQEAQ